MIYIIYDLEFTVVRKQQHLSEIIEIGAVKVAEMNGILHIVDKFQTFVRPSKNPVLSKHTTEFTGIRQEDMTGAPDYREAVDQWVKWIGEENYYLGAWGSDDKYQLIRHCRQMKLEPDWVKNHNNLQKQYSKKTSGEIYQQVGLKRALEIEGIAFEGSHHRALDDAFNTALIFIKRFEDFELQTNAPEDDYTYSSEVVYSSGKEDASSPFQALAKLLRPDAS
ncbi:MULTISPECIES: 3'-5' exonuclease [unclassified Paenibacillus]|uniref:3'-5' exonuclease n=1 Tax=unclassified Paenibacillus TaxID=185978 RepID=UPI001AE98800|nr:MULTISPECIES: 3'-5' exonuclease [unclassified Paenibacillus]MBP1154523.1 inhibitor of KinA sporulation pathway (predicted exonuclease) [Paenibacillus sp. PvP091]MBP1170093.1 inhibitor of KinA sporulation pathway (predicted exonuclease) [Paenibacillus sp. PvR098]MBP2441121.1 inhibitor of KinA sporulation pathway (predicted exonuclease) [Paenibacillus sp. PvP052]